MMPGRDQKEMEEDGGVGGSADEIKERGSERNYLSLTETIFHSYCVAQ